MSFYGMFKDYVEFKLDVIKTVAKPIGEMLGVEEIKEDLSKIKDSIKKNKE